jgi:hypothetical protein
VVLAASQAVSRSQCLVVAKLTPASQLDPAFGVGGIAKVGGAGTGGDNVVPGPGGTIVTLTRAACADGAARSTCS